MPLKYVPLGLAGIECSKHSPFLEDLKVQTAEIDSFYKLNEPCGWHQFYGYALVASHSTQELAEEARSARSWVRNVCNYCSLCSRHSTIAKK